MQQKEQKFQGILDSLSSITISEHQIAKTPKQKPNQFNQTGIEFTQTKGSTFGTQSVDVTDSTQLARQEFIKNLGKILEDDPKQTPFQKQSISERLEQLRQLGYKQDKKIEDQAFWANVRQIKAESNARKRNAQRIFSHQTHCRQIWDQNQERKRDPKKQFYLPGPADYSFKNFMQEDPSFPGLKFQKAQRPLNQATIKLQTERIEEIDRRQVFEKNQTIPDYKGCKQQFKKILVDTSFGMKPTRVSDIGRRLKKLMCDDDKILPFGDRPGFTQSISVRTQPRNWDYVQVKLWPRCAYEPLKTIQ